MNGREFQRFLGVEPDADAARLLGLSDAAPLGVPMIEDALHKRLAQVYNHPEGRTDEAEDVRRALREAAATLKAECGGTRYSPFALAGSQRWAVSVQSGSCRPQRLTEFDEQVLAVLVGSGGWNAMSRARLIALAASHGIASHGLLKVIAGLAKTNQHLNRSTGPVTDRLRGRGQQPAMAQRSPIRSANGQPATGTNGPATGAVPVAIQQSAENATAKHDDDEIGTTWRTVKLSIIYGLLTIVIAVVAIVLLVPQQVLEWPFAALRLPFFQDQRAPQVERPMHPVAPGVVHQQDEESAIVEDPPQRRRERIDWGTARFDAQPTFHVAFPPAAYNAKPIAEVAPEDLDELARRASVARGAGGIAEPVFRTWEDVITNVSTCWPLLDPNLLRSIERGVIDVLLATGSPVGTLPDADIKRLLNGLDPPVGALNDPLDLWRGAWKTNMLAAAALHPDLPGRVIEHAEARLDVALDRRSGAPRSNRRMSGAQAAALWLDRVEPQLIAALSEPHRAYELWDLWIEARKRLGPSERFHSALIAAVASILTEHPSEARLAAVGFSKDGTRIEPTTPSADLNLIGRLIEEANFNTSPGVREALLAIFENERIGMADIWLLTSLLARSPRVAWFDETLVVFPQSDESVRPRARQDIGRAWPEFAATAIAHRTRIDPVSGERWLRAVEKIEGESIDVESEEALLRQILRTVQLNEAAAYLAVQTPVRAERLLDEIARTDRTSAAPPDRRQRVGRPIGRDDGWSTAYEEARRDVEERMRLMRALRSSAGGDLPPDDAAVFVREVYRGAPADLRELAQTILVDVFGRGPNVAREMLDQFPSPGSVPRSAALTQTLSRYTARSLPSIQGGSQEWALHTRLALVEHLLSLLNDRAPMIDGLAGEIGRSYAAQADVLKNTPRESATTGAAAPSFAAAMIFDHWRERAHTYAASRLGQDIESFERRHAARLRMADGPIQETIALRIGTLELMAIVTRAESPQEDRRIKAILESAAAQRNEAQSALLQALFVERTIAAMWRARLDVPMGEEVHSSRPERSPIRHSRESGNPIIAHRPLYPTSIIIALSALPLDARFRGHDDRWMARLESLDPENPTDYFELAEEMADTADPAAIEVAGHLFRLAGALDPKNLGRSACLALADLEETDHTRRRLLALAEVLGARDAPDQHSDQPHEAHADADRRSAALALSEAFGLYRQGHGPRAASLLRRDEVRRLLQSVEDAVPWPSAQHFIDECAAPRPRRPSMSEANLVRMLQVERLVLSGDERDWSMELAFSHGRPLIELDPDRLDVALNADLSKPFFRGGRWVSRP